MSNNKKLKKILFFDFQKWTTIWANFCHTFSSAIECSGRCFEWRESKFLGLKMCWYFWKGWASGRRNLWVTFIYLLLLLATKKKQHLYFLFKQKKNHRKVYLAKNKQTNEVVALKKIRMKNEKEGVNHNSFFLFFYEKKCLIWKKK